MFISDNQPLNRCSRREGGSLFECGLWNAELSQSLLASAATRFMESSVFLSDLLTAHEPKMRKPMEINERIFWFRERDRACGHCHHRDPRWAVAARARRRQIQGAHDQMSQQSEAAWFVHLALHVGLQHSYFLF